MKRLLALAIALLGFASCSTPTTQKPEEAQAVKADNRYYYEFNALTQADFAEFEDSIPDRYLTFTEIKSFRDVARSKAVSISSDYDVQRIDFYDFFVPMGMTVKEIDAWMDVVDKRGNGLFTVTSGEYILVMYAEVQ